MEIRNASVWYVAKAVDAQEKVFARITFPGLVFATMRWTAAYVYIVSAARETKGHCCNFIAAEEARTTSALTREACYTENLISRAAERM